MRKIVFTVTTDLNHDQRMQRICHSLSGRGYEIELVGRILPSSKPLQQQTYRQHRIRCHFHTGKLFYLEYMLRLYWYLIRKNYDAYCGIDLDTALPVYFCARKAGKPFVYDAHEYFPEVIEVTDRKFVKAAWTAIEKFVVRRTRHAYTVTGSIARIFEQKYGTAFEVVRNISPLEEYTPLTKSTPTILYQGAVNEGRGLEQLVCAMAGVEAKLVICGDGDIMEKLVQLAKEAGVLPKIEFKGKVLPRELLLFTRQAYIGIMLLENKGLSYYYSLANKFFDYIHAGIPQLVVDFPEYRELNERYQVALYTSLEVKEIEQKLNLLLQDKALYDRLSANCMQARQELNWQEEEKKLWRFYEQIWQT